MARLEGADQVVQEEPAKEPREHPHRQEEPGSAANPLGPIGRKAPTADHAVQVRVKKQGLPPGMQHGKKADFGPEVLGVALRLIVRLEKWLLERLSQG